MVGGKTTKACKASRSPRISIVVPVYNAEAHLAETVDSLLSQTYRDIEVVCVNDGSTDGSAAVLERYAATDGRVRVLAQENAGVSVARNVGIDAAAGEILMFCDADDRYAPNACKRVAEIFDDKEVEMLTFGFAVEPVEAMPIGMKRELSPPDKTYTKFAPTLLFDDHARPYHWRTAFSRALIERESIRFEPGIALGEDQVVYFASYPFSKKTVLLSDQLYIYRMNADSAMHANAVAADSAFERIQQHLMVIEAILRLWEKRDLRGLCDAELLEWVLDFVMFDVNGQPPQRRHACFQRLMDTLDAFFGGSPESHARRAATRRCLHDIRALLARAGEGADAGSGASAGTIPFLHLGRFYLSRYGFVRCVQQMLIERGILKKWK